MGTMHAITTQYLVKDDHRRGRHSCGVQVSSVLQQCMEDDLLLVTIDTQHHGSRHENVLGEKPS